MRMRELEKQTGIGRETIRFYIREGLLPEPSRTSRNSASYSDDHVTRLRAIKRLQEERFLPLAVIRSLLDDEGGDRWLEPQAFPQLDALLRARLDTDSARVRRADVMSQTGLDDIQIDRMVTEATIAIDAAGTMSARDAAIARCLGQLNAIGFTDESGFGDTGIKLYRDVIDWLVTQEMRLFFDQTAGQVGEATATDMAERGVSVVNEMLSHMRTREILRRLEARRRIANDNL
jgi:DNA-binding transcriptional MerR regulator